MRQLPFRRRLTLWSTILAVVVLLVSAAGAGFFVYRKALAKLDEELRSESEHFFSELSQHGGAEGFNWNKIEPELREWLPPEIPQRLVEIRTGGHQLRYRSKELPETWLNDPTPGMRNLELGTQEMRLLVAEQGGVTFAMAADLAETRSLVVDLALGFLAALPLALAFAWFGGRWLAARAVQPVREITAAAKLVTAEHLDRRVPVPPVEDEIQALAQVLNTTLDRLDRSYAQALRFSADASHELKTPLTVLRASLEAILESPTLAEHDRTALAGLIEQTQRLSSITVSLLLLARADAGRLMLDAAEHDLTMLTEGCAEDARIIGEARQIRMECVLPPLALARVDALRFCQITSNLLANAVKYNRPNGEIRVSLTDEGTVWRLNVGNHGAGIPLEHQERLFERFFRAEHTEEESGQGLGLSLARELAHAHGGKLVLVRSEADWTEFSVTLPKEGPTVASRKSS